MVNTRWKEWELTHGQVKRHRHLHTINKRLIIDGQLPKFKEIQFNIHSANHEIRLTSKLKGVEVVSQDLNNYANELTFLFSIFSLGRGGGVQGVVEQIEGGLIFLVLF